MSTKSRGTKVRTLKSSVFLIIILLIVGGIGFFVLFTDSLTGKATTLPADDFTRAYYTVRMQDSEADFTFSQYKNYLILFFDKGGSGYPPWQDSCKALNDETTFFLTSLGNLKSFQNSPLNQIQTCLTESNSICEELGATIGFEWALHNDVRKIESGGLFKSPQNSLAYTASMLKQGHKTVDGFISNLMRKYPDDSRRGGSSSNSQIKAAEELLTHCQSELVKKPKEQITYLKGLIPDTAQNEFKSVVAASLGR